MKSCAEARPSFRRRLIFTTRGQRIRQVMSDQPIHAYQFDDSGLSGFLFRKGITAPHMSDPGRGMVNQPTIITGLPHYNGLTASEGSDIIWPPCGQTIRTQYYKGSRPIEEGQHLILSAGIITTITDGIEEHFLTEQSAPDKYLVMVATGQPLPRLQENKTPHAHGALPHRGHPRRLSSWQSRGRYNKILSPFARKELWEMSVDDELLIQRVYDPSVLLVARKHEVQMVDFPKKAKRSANGRERVQDVAA
jgi:hypothetical protein